METFYEQLPSVVAAGDAQASQQTKLLHPATKIYINIYDLEIILSIFSEYTADINSQALRSVLADLK